MAIPIPITACSLAGISVPSFAYRSCPAALSDPLVGTLAVGDNFLTLTLWFLLACISENLVIRFSSRAFSSGIAYATCELLRHHVVHRSSLNVIFLSFQSIVGLCFHNHGIPRMTLWFCKFATWKVTNSLWLLMSIGTFVIWVTGPIALGFPSAR